MNKTELCAKLAKKTGLTKTQATDVVNALFDTEPGKGIMTVELDAGRSVTIPGFGTYDTARRKARIRYCASQGAPGSKSTDRSANPDRSTHCTHI